MLCKENWFPAFAGKTHVQRFRKLLPSLSEGGNVVSLGRAKTAWPFFASLPFHTLPKQEWPWKPPSGLRRAGSSGVSRRRTIPMPDRILPRYAISLRR